MNLDDVWGACLTPPYYSAAESLFQPRSLMLLSQHHHELRTYFELTEKGFALSQLVHQAATILWVVDKDGEIRVAIEEQVSEAGKTSILLRGFDPAFSFIKLGHPALLEYGGDKLGRCGGEITWDGRLNGRPNWVISNRSGRYGLRDGQRESLAAVVKAFEQHNIFLTGWLLDAKGKVHLL